MAFRVARTNRSITAVREPMMARELMKDAPTMSLQSFTSHWRIAMPSARIATGSLFRKQTTAAARPLSSVDSWV